MLLLFQFKCLNVCSSFSISNPFEIFFRFTGKRNTEGNISKLLPQKQKTSSNSYFFTAMIFFLYFRTLIFTLKLNSIKSHLQIYVAYVIFPEVSIFYCFYNNITICIYSPNQVKTRIILLGFSILTNFGQNHCI